MNLFGNTYTNSLYVIGNGFDLAHGMKTSWKDFYNWLKDNGYRMLVDFCDSHFGMDSDLWKDFETALGEYDLDTIYEYCAEDIEIDEDHMMRTHFIIEDSPDTFFTPRKEELVKCFIDWVTSIEISNHTLNIEVPYEAKYLTFNYTETLEKLYRIPQSQVLHIHGDVYNPIFGHGQSIKEYWNNHELDSTQTAKQKIIAEMNELRKDVQGIIAANSTYFDSLANIQEIIIRGISYGPIDFPYFQKLKNSVRHNCLWRLSWHNGKDYATAINFAKSLRINAEFFKF